MVEGLGLTVGEAGSVDCDACSDGRVHKDGGTGDRKARSGRFPVDVRDGAVEESQRSEGDDMGLRVLIGRKQAVVSTNDMSGDGVTALAERAVAMARVAPEDKYAGLAKVRFAHTEMVERI